MKLFFTETQLAHQPKQYMVHGQIVDPFENPNRATTLIDVAGERRLERAEPADFGRAPILKVHADHYVAFLEEAYARFMELPNHGPGGAAQRASLSRRVAGLCRSRAAARHRHHRPRRLVHGRPLLRDHGGHVPCRVCLGADGDRGCRGRAGRCAGGLFAVPSAGAPRLRRPLLGLLLFQQRGHRRRGAARQVSARRHHRFRHPPRRRHAGDLLSRDDVFYGSVHTDPSAYYPHFAGYADETGTGAGEGANLNLPLPFGADDDAFIAANARLCEAVKRTWREALVLSAGWDAHRDDPLSKLAVSTDAYARIGELYGKLGLPTLIVQEGGYSLDAIAAASHAFMRRVP